MVAGVIATAVADRLMITHLSGDASASFTAVALAGLALFLGGHALFKLALSGRVLRSHPVGIVVLGLLAPASSIVPPLAVGAGAVLVLIAVASWDTLSGRRNVVGAVDA
jgi:low temperature requirement protein LtrA